MLFIKEETVNIWNSHLAMPMAILQILCVCETRLTNLELNVSGASHHGPQVSGAGAHVSQAVVPHESVPLLLHRVLHLNRVGKNLKASMHTVKIKVDWGGCKEGAPRKSSPHRSSVWEKLPKNRLASPTFGVGTHRVGNPRSATGIWYLTKVSILLAWRPTGFVTVRKQSFGKVTLLHLSVILSTGGGVHPLTDRHAHWQTNALGRHTPLADTP